MEKKKYGMIQLDVDVHNALKEYCKKQGFIMSAFVNNLIKKSIKGKQYVYNQIRKHFRGRH